MNRIKAILRRHNLEQECPTKKLQTKRARQWLDRLPLSIVERCELDPQLTRHDLAFRARITTASFFINFKWNSVVWSETKPCRFDAVSVKDLHSLAGGQTTS